MATKAEEKGHAEAHAASRVEFDDQWREALRNELGMLEAHHAAGREGREFTDVARRIDEVKALLGDRSVTQAAVRQDAQAETRSDPNAA